MWSAYLSITRVPKTVQCEEPARVYARADTRGGTRNNYVTARAPKELIEGLRGVALSDGCYSPCWRAIAPRFPHAHV